MAERPDARWLWIGAAATWLGAAALLRAGGTHLSLSAMDAAFGAFVMMSIVAYRRQHRFPSEAMRVGIRCAHGVALLSSVGAAAALLSYAVAQHGRGYSDDALVAIDRFLGFDWRALYDLERRHEPLIWMARAAYGMIDLLQLLLVAGLFLTGQEQRFLQFVRACMLSLGITIAIFAFFPLQSALFHLVGSRPPYLPCTGLLSASVLARLQDGTIGTLALDDMIGLIGVPSFHAVAAILYIWGSWTVRVYRYPMLAINLAMLVATPVEGAHYLTDVLAGVVVAAIAICVTTRAPRLLAAPKGTLAWRRPPIGHFGMPERA